LENRTVAFMLLVQHQTGGINMTNRVGNKNEAQLRGKQERKAIKEGNREREAVKQATARAKYRNAVKGQPQTATA